MRAHVLAALAALLVAGPAWAQKGDPHAVAEEQFQRGREAMKRDDCKRALDLFQTSHRLEPGRGKLVNMAICEQKLGKLVSALRHFQEVLPQLPAGDDRVAIVKAGIAELKPRVARIEITLAPGAPPGTTVKLDGEEVSASMIGTTIPVEAGKHVVVASAPGASDVTADVTVGDREGKAISIAPRPPPAPVVTPPAPAAPADDAPRPLLWKLGVAALGVGGASLLAGIGTGAGAMAKRAGILDRCPSGTCPAGSSGIASDNTAFEAMANASTATFVIGGALAAGGVALLVVSRRASKPAPAARIEPIIGPGTLGAQGWF